MTLISLKLYGRSALLLKMHCSVIKMRDAQCENYENMQVQ